MNKPIKTVTAALVLAAGLSAQLGCGKKTTSSSGNITTRLPQDVLQSCTVSPQEFDTWFVDGKVSLNGAVSPANSVTFPHNDNCDFYKWSQQMFLWITSPASGAGYKGNKTVLESPVFYTVTPQGKDGKRTLVPHTPDTKLRVTSNIAQTGPDRLPVVVDKQGRLFEVVSSTAQGDKVMLKDAAGKNVELGGIKKQQHGQVLFLDKAGKTIQKPKPVLKSNADAGVQQNIAHEFRLGVNQSVFLDAKGNIIDTEVGQATQDALIAQTGSMVYYITMVNDVYAYFLTGVNENALNGSTFPTTAVALDSILQYAQLNGWPAPPDANALAMELKTSWVEVENLPNPESYITIEAIVPEYDKTNPAYWLPKGERTARLALVGMHVVGSVAGHPEMIWATFEHQKNAPNASYSYVDSNNIVKTVPADTGGGWLLNNNPLDTPVNITHMKVSGDTIKAVMPYGFTASNTQMTKPFGVAPNMTPNAEDVTPEVSNSKVISINNSIFNMLMGNDVRKNYYLIGATWTNGGNGPNGLAYPASSQSLNDAIGTSQLANSTMETYFQFGTQYNQNGSCFRCHSDNNGLAPSDLSHVFEDIRSLPPMQKK
jgi:hypothetical protein